tara:strand:+ start:140 stop:499 length:360 start_codon:yes stop_codon:yes gene_type:complete
MNNKTCNRCGKKGLDWDLEFHKKMDKWKLENHKTVNGKWCNKPKETLMGKKTDYYICELCSESNFGNVRIEDKEEHIKRYHPNGEMLTDLDYIHEHQSAYTTKVFWKHDPHYYKYVNNK